tara:strand:+ start:1848 stop:2336 length:489 start_codon:yes stop_codon:yes gene_type:complete
MASNEHKNLLDSNRHNPLGTEAAPNNTYLGKLGGVSWDDGLGSLSWTHSLETFTLRLDGSLATNTDVDYMRMPYNFRLTAVRASILTEGSLVTVDVQESGVSMLSTLLTIDATEKTSTTAAVPVVISDYAIADDAEVTIDLTIGGVEVPTDLKVYLIGYRTT